MPAKQTKSETRDILLRDLPIHLADKVKVAATLHRESMKDYILEILRHHIEELESRGIVLTLPASKKRV
jgi:plasmid stability protein